MSPGREDCSHLCPIVVTQQSPNLSWAWTERQFLQRWRRIRSHRTAEAFHLLYLLRLVPNLIRKCFDMKQFPITICQHCQTEYNMDLNNLWLFCDCWRNLMPCGWFESKEVTHPEKFKRAERSVQNCFQFPENSFKYSQTELWKLQLHTFEPMSRASPALRKWKQNWSKK